MRCGPCAEARDGYQGRMSPENGETEPPQPGARGLAMKGQVFLAAQTVSG